MTQLPGRNRQPNFDGTRAILHVYLSPEVKAELQGIAQDNHRSASAEAVTAILEHINKAYREQQSS